MKPADKRSWYVNLFVWSNLTLGHSFLAGSIIIAPRGWNVKITCRKQWAGHLPLILNVLMFNVCVQT